ncbi:hypothetical protein ES332_A01G208500v1 [Gossypium tomentosum]|uniref:Knottin scorpion toxin-like domain-containing protein n=1 Tax=Gossypium tomentosum TaxID=34277 RepID=A0A5D2RWZ3_GOSTO|nr:hypothetical protein ES332_A01G208500v1 [Gossypium tomentosum]
MKSLEMSAIIIVVILFVLGNEIMAQDSEVRVCGVPFMLPNCRDDGCKRGCANKFSPNGNGICQGGSNCLCFRPCV